MWQWKGIKAFNEGLHSFTSVTDIILTEIFKNWILKVDVTTTKTRANSESETVIEGRTVELRANLEN